jgi:hypothetical protein
MTGKISRQKRSVMTDAEITKRVAQIDSKIADLEKQIDKLDEDVPDDYPYESTPKQRKLEKELHGLRVNRKHLRDGVPQRDYA